MLAKMMLVKRILPQKKQLAVKEKRQLLLNLAKLRRAQNQLVLHSTATG